MTEVNIDYSKDGSAYRIMLDVRSLDIIAAAAQQDSIKNLEGEALAAALLKFARGGVMRISRFKDNIRNDGPDGEPAMQRYNAEGKVEATLHMQADVLHDSIKGAAALQEMRFGMLFRQHYKNGQLHNGAKGEAATYGPDAKGEHIHERYYENGVLQDVDGTPALRVYTRDKLLILTQRYTAGVMTDGAHGEPAFVRYTADGKRLQLVQHYKNGKLHDGDDGSPAKVKYSAETGRITNIGYFTDGIRNDGANGDAAVQAFVQGKLVLKEHYKDGLLNDGINGEPAVQNFSYTGDAPAIIKHYKLGKLNDGANGEAAVQEYRDGALYRVKHYKDGAPCNGPNGEPAVQNYMDGKLSSAMTVRPDGTLKDLTRREREAFDAKAEGKKIDAIQKGFGGKLKFGK